MQSTRDQLLTCFALVFPGKSPAQLVAADIDTLPEWDSSNHILLLQVIEEQFGSPIPDDVMGEMISFSALERHLNGQGQAR